MTNPNLQVGDSDYKFQIGFSRELYQDFWLKPSYFLVLTPQPEEPVPTFIGVGVSHTCYYCSVKRKVSKKSLKFGINNLEFHQKYLFL